MSDEISLMRERMGQQLRERLPFNPVDGVDITGANVSRLQLSMEGFGWSDHRFVTAEQATANGWAVAATAKSVQIEVRDPANGTVAGRKLFNAANVLGMPSIEAMFALSDQDLLKMRQSADSGLQQPAPSPSPGLAAEVEAEEGFEIGPAAQPEVEVAAQAVEPPFDEQRFASSAPLKAAPDFAVMAPYWRNGLHNFDGVELSKDINRVAEAQKLNKDKAALDKLLSTYAKASRLGLEVVDRQKLLDDLEYRANRAEPATLAGGELVRDLDGAYRPAAGGLPLVTDKGATLALRNKSDLACRGAMELAKAKGWTAIELKGSQKMMASAWLEAKVMGIEVVNFVPTAKDQEKLAERMAQEARKREAQAQREQAETLVEVHPVVDPMGKQVLATVSQTVQHSPPSGPTQGPSDAQTQTVTRTVARVEGLVREDVSAQVELPAAANAPRERSVGEAGAEVSRSIDAILTEQHQERAAIAALEGVSNEGAPSARLMRHGVAPYLHNGSNNESYFAELELQDGSIVAVWGKDIERALHDAGAQVGDMIALDEVGREPVTVAGKQVHRVQWLATVHERALQSNKGAERDGAGEAEQQASVEQPVQRTPSTGTYIGPIVRIENGRFAQKTGRDPDKVVWHDVSVLGGKSPVVGGEPVEIHYGLAGGKLKTPDRQQELSR